MVQYDPIISNQKVALIKGVWMYIEMLKLFTLLKLSTEVLRWNDFYHCQEEDMYVFLGIDIFVHEIFKYYTKRNELDVAFFSFVF